MEIRNQDIARHFGVIGVVPFWSQSDNMNVDSNYAYLRIVLPEMERQTENTLFLVFFPDPKYGRDKWRYTPDGLQSERIRLISWPYETSMRASVMGWDSRKHGELEDRHGINVYWLNQVESGIHLYGGFWQGMSKRQRPLLIAQHHYIIHKSLPYSVKPQFPRRWMQMGGSIAADAVIYNSQHCHRMALESFADYLNEGAMAELEEKSHVLPFGLIRGDEPVAPMADSPAQHPPVILYNHRFEAYKNADQTFEVLGSLRDQHNFEVWVTQAHGQPTKNFHYDKVVFEPKRTDYLKRIAVPAINTINSSHETFCIAMLDSLMMGHLIVAPNSMTFPELVPHDYPYLFSSPTEQRQMLDVILRTWPAEYNAWHERLIEHVRAKFNLQDYVSNYLSVMWEMEVQQRDVEVKPRVKKGIAKVFDSMTVGKPYPIMELRNIIWRDVNLALQSCSSLRVIREAMERGGIEVVWDSGGVCLVRRG